MKVFLKVAHLPWESGFLGFYNKIIFRVDTRIVKWCCKKTRVIDKRTFGCFQKQNIIPFSFFFFLTCVLGLARALSKSFSRGKKCVFPFFQVRLLTKKKDFLKALVMRLLSRSNQRGKSFFGLFVRFRSFFNIFTVSSMKALVISYTCLRQT